MDGQKSLKDLLSGLIFVGFGLAFGYASSNYTIGTALQMGPGYFPLILSGVLVLLGLVVLVRGFAAGSDEIPVGAIPWRGLLLLIGSLVFFGYTVRGLGLMPALFLTVTAAALGSQRTGIVGATVISGGLTLLCYIIFVWALALPLQVVGPWLRF